MKKIFFALLGPTGCGKSELVKLMLARHPGMLADIASFTTREPREDDEPGAYRFVKRDEFERMIAADELVQWSEYGGNLYGDDRASLEAVYAAGKFPIRPLVEPSVLKFREAGYPVFAIGVRPVLGYKPRSPERAQADTERARLLKPDVSLRNSFAPGGLQEAADLLSIMILAAIQIAAHPPRPFP